MGTSSREKDSEVPMKRLGGIAWLQLFVMKLQFAGSFIPSFLSSTYYFEEYPFVRLVAASSAKLDRTNQNARVEGLI